MNEWWWREERAWRERLWGCLWIFHLDILTWKIELDFPCTPGAWKKQKNPHGLGWQKRCSHILNFCTQWGMAWGRTTSVVRYLSYALDVYSCALRADSISLISSVINSSSSLKSPSGINHYLLSQKYVFELLESFDENEEKKWKEIGWRNYELFLHDYRITSMLRLCQWFAYIIYYKA